MKYSYEIIGAKDIGLQYLEGQVRAAKPISALKKAAQIGKNEFGELYRIRIVDGEIGIGKPVIEFFSRAAAKQRSTIEGMPELKNPAATGLVRVRENNKWIAVKFSLESLI